MLVVEVADTSAATDRGVKLPAYARAGIAEVWLVDLPAGVIEVHLDPSAEGYGRAEVFGPGQVVTATAAGTAASGIAVDAGEILGVSGG